LISIFGSKSEHKSSLIVEEELIILQSIDIEEDDRFEIFEDDEFGIFVTELEESEGSSLLKEQAINV